MIKKRWNIKKEKLKEKLLNEQQGFIVGNALIILPLIFSLIIAILVIVQAISSSIFNYIDNWILQEQTKNILENMATDLRVISFPSFFNIQLKKLVPSFRVN